MYQDRGISQSLSVMNQLPISADAAVRILNSRSVITAAGYYSGKITSVSTQVFTHTYENGDTRNYRIVNLDAHNMHGLSTAKTAIQKLGRGASDYRSALNTNLSFRDYNMSLGKGMLVDYVVEDVLLKKGDYAGSTALLVQSVTPKVAVAAAKMSMNLDDFFNDAPITTASVVGATAEPVETAAVETVAVKASKPKAKATAGK